MKKTARSLWIIDDDELFIFYTKRIVEIELLTDRVRTFKNAMSAICCLEDNKDDPDELPDIILLDIYMPFQTGWEFHEEFMQLKPELKKDIKLYMASCSLDLRDLDRIKTLPAVTDCIIKPVTAKRLKDIIQESQQKRILIVDDECDFCFLLSKSLNQKGFRTDYVTSLESARNILLENRYNMVFLDYNLTDGYGTELVPHLKVHSPYTSIVMMSGQTDAMISKEALSEGANFFMNKPLLPEGMEIVLKTLRSTQTTAA